MWQQYSARSRQPIIINIIYYLSRYDRWPAQLDNNHSNMPIIGGREESLRDEEDSGELQTPYVSVTILCIRTSINKFNGLQKIVFFFLLFPFTRIIISRYSEDIHIKYCSFFFTTYLIIHASVPMMQYVYLVIRSSRAQLKRGRSCISWKYRRSGRVHVWMPWNHRSLLET